MSVPPHLCIHFVASSETVTGSATVSDMIPASSRRSEVRGWELQRVAKNRPRDTAHQSSLDQNSRGLNGYVPHMSEKASRVGGSNTQSGLRLVSIILREHILSQLCLDTSEPGRQSQETPGLSHTIYCLRRRLSPFSRGEWLDSDPATRSRGIPGLDPWLLSRSKGSRNFGTASFQVLGHALKLRFIH